MGSQSIAIDGESRKHISLFNKPFLGFSALLNTLQKHFFDFVNSYRIDYAKELLRNSDQMKTYTIEAIAEQCDFNNKVSFNKAFKKITGHTPSHFRLMVK